MGELDIFVKFLIENRWEILFKKLDGNRTENENLDDAPLFYSFDLLKTQIEHQI